MQVKKFKKLAIRIKATPCTINEYNPTTGNPTNTILYNPDGTIQSIRQFDDLSKFPQNIHYFRVTFYNENDTSTGEITKEVTSNFTPQQIQQAKQLHSQSLYQEAMDLYNQHNKKK
ncbi:DUF2963 domain-containing protein [Candidatus Phytoplasma meliae]|uniref:DUF2963 domain-containing protein n=1 Tax=Candidatus Phytoplasma meliae TaxID=1848402 RepID=A0ABS5CYS6_9MOLU|nr:DUF2963 domain-containing protein [Candidatus Phytoplasma meliae]